jgi:hypothetical protein
MKFSSLPKIPNGRVPAPRSTVPHLALAGMFAKLAALHAQRAMANAPDATNARLPRPDMAAIDSQQGRPLVRQPVIGTPMPY